MKLKVDFSIDHYTEKKIDLKKWRKELSQVLIRKNNNYYFSEICDYYHKKTYKQCLVEVLSKKINIPSCPVTGGYPSYKLQGSIIIGKYSSNCSNKDMNKHIAENNVNFKKHIERMKVDRIKDGNPMYNKIPWNEGLTKFSNKSLMENSKKQTGKVMSESSKKKMSISAKKRKIHGHTGFKHSEETKQLLREITIERYKNGGYPQTNSAPHRAVKKIIKNHYDKSEWEEEFPFEGFVFDFKIKNVLIEVQGDYFHSNPKTRHSACTSDVQIKNKKRDIRKKEAVKNSDDYSLLEIWENDINHGLSQVKKVIACLKK